MLERPSADQMEQLRLEYPLTEQSLVVDAGAYQGHWAHAMRQKYGCRIIAYEPCPPYYETLKARFALDPNVTVKPCGLGLKDTKMRFGFDADSTGLYTSTKHHFTADIRDAANELDGLTIALLKMNVEGMEYDILERLLERNLTPNIAHLQVQFHCLRPDHTKRHNAIRQALANTHDLQWSVPWVWESWRRK